MAGIKSRLERLEAAADRQPPAHSELRALLTWCSTPELDTLIAVLRDRRDGQADALSDPTVAEILGRARARAAAGDPPFEW